MINRIASDLGIIRFAEEPITQYRCRVIYSAMACWIKTIVLDTPIGQKEKELIGVSRRHIFERGHVILDAMIKMFPDVGEWFNASDDKDDPVNLIRKRLINHGDLLNAGFETNLALSSVYTSQLNAELATIFGKIIEKSIRYSGISSIQQNNQQNNEDIEEVELDNVEDWFQAFLKSACWTHALPDPRRMQFYNPYSKTKNNNDAWQDNMANIPDNVVLARMKANLNSNSFFLINRKNMLIHEVDSFLKEQLIQIRIMCALRANAGNTTEAVITKSVDHVLLHLNAWLPLKERILLESYAWPLRCIDDKIEWIMDNSIWDYVKPYIDALDILIKEEKHG